MKERSSSVVTVVNPYDDAEALYNSKLRSILEPALDGQYVAIHPGSGEYVVDRRRGKALRTLIERQPSGPILIRHIGVADEGLKARLLGERP